MGTAVPHSSVGSSHRLGRFTAAAGTTTKGRKAHTCRVHKRSVMHHSRGFGGWDAPWAHDAFGLCALRKRVRVSCSGRKLSSLHRPVHLPQTVRQGSDVARVSYHDTREPECPQSSRVSLAARPGLRKTWLGLLRERPLLAESSHRFIAPVHSTRKAY